MAIVREKKHILIVEDDQTLFSLLKMKLTKQGFVVDEANDAETAYQTLRAMRCDLILLDILLSGADGYTILKQLKGSEQWKHIPIIVLSNLGSLEDKKKALQLGAYDFLIKAEHSLESVVEKIQAALQ